MDPLLKLPRGGEGTPDYHNVNTSDAHFKCECVVELTHPSALGFNHAPAGSAGNLQVWVVSVPPAHCAFE